MKDELVIGLLSGARGDGAHAVLVNFTCSRVALLHARRTPYPAAIRRMLEQLLESAQTPDENLAKLLDDSLGRYFARIAQDLVREAGMEMRDINAIGWHTPHTEPPLSLQLGNSALLARNTGVTVVVGFHNADLAAGGRGAPLAPLLHRQLFYTEQENRAVVSIGDTARLTLLPAGGGLSGFDCGPGVCLLDAWTRQHLQIPRDDAGRWAASGRVNDDLLRRLLGDPYFDIPPSQRTGAQHFNMAWLESYLAGHVIEAADVQATLAEFTARAIAHGLAGGTLPKRLLVCGDGAYNTHLLGRLAAVLPAVVVDTTARYGADPTWLESLLFAWLARERLAGRAQDTGPLTGARPPVLLGRIFEP